MMEAQTKPTTSQLPEAAATALPVQAAAVRESKRLLFLDNLRIVLMCGVLVNHLNDTYGAVGAWEYHDPVTNLLTATILTILNGILMACGMGLFFLLAGYFTPGSYDRKGPRAFVQGRLVRLGIPLLLYDLLIQPLVVYLAAGLPGSYWSFYGTFLLQTRGIIGVVWFLAVLLVFDLLYAAWRMLIRHHRSASATGGIFPSSSAIVGFICALGLVTFVVRIWWPAGWTLQLLPGLKIGYLPQYASLYILGLVAYRRNWFFTLTSRMARNWSLIAGLSTLIFGGLAFSSMMQETGAAGTHQASYAIAGGFNWLALSYALWESFLVVGVSMGLLVLLRERWNQQGRLAKELAADVYTVYLIHAPVLIGFAYAFHVVALYPLLKWTVAVVVTIPLCFLISSGIRRIPLVNRVL
jgi:surface polysaccharide O-acyltransferase-like enzyme